MTGIVSSIALGGIVSKAKGVAESIPPKVWYALALIAALFAGYLWHGHSVKKHDAALVASTTASVNAAWQKAFDKERQAALAWKGNADQLHTRIANDERKIHDQAVADNAAAADALRLRGPGAASAGRCGSSDYSGASAAPVRHDQAAAGASAPAAQVPSGDRAIVSWDWLVQIVQEHDDLLADVKSTINNDRKQRAAWPNEAKPSDSVPQSARPILLR